METTKARTINHRRRKIINLTPEAPISKVHQQTVTPFFNFVSKLTYDGQPEEFLSAHLVIEILHDRGVTPRNFSG